MKPKARWSDQKRPRRNDQKRLQVEAAQGAGRAWALLRDMYSPEVCQLVDELDRGGGLSLHDLVLLEVAELMTMRADLHELDSPGERALERMNSLMLQSRKNLRSLVESMGETGDADNRTVVVPEGLRVLPPPDDGDDLL